MKLQKLIGIGAVLLSAATVMAQGFPGMPGGGGQRGMMRMMGGANMPPYMLLQRDDVQEDLKLTDDQKSKLRDFQGNMQQKMQEQMASVMASGQRPNQQEMRAMFERMNKEASDEVAKILTADQSKRLNEISIQLAGNQAVMRDDVKKELKLTAEQETKIRELQGKAREANQALMRQARDGNIAWEEVGKRRENNDKILNEEIGKILTAAQREQLAKMGGAKFVEKVEER